MASTSVTSPDRTERRRVLERSWVIGVVAFVLVRFVIAYSSLARYGRTTVIVFGILDVATAVPYAVGTARLVTSVVDGDLRAAARWGAISCASFLVPYLWLTWAGRESLPMLAYLVIGVLTVLLGANAVTGVVRRIRDERRSAAEVGDHP